MTNETLLDALDHIHKMSMSKDEHKATTGRCLKLFYEQFDAFDKEECARGVHRGMVIFGMVHAMAVIAAVTALSGVRDGHEREALDNTIKLFDEVVNSVYDAKVNSGMDRENT